MSDAIKGNGSLADTAAKAVEQLAKKLRDGAK